MSRYDPIFEWKMTAPEAESYKIALIWEDEVDRQIPIHMKTPEWWRRNHIPRRGDPRKCHLFKHCWKLRRSTKGLLKEEDYRFYILSNILVLKSFNAYLEVNTICGDKAWIRWKVWKRLYDKRMAEIHHELPPPVTDGRITRELLRTKRHIFEKCDGEPTKDKIVKFINSSVFKVWIMQGKVSTYYAVLSPYVTDHLESLAKECSFDPTLFKEKVADDTIQFFKYEFSHEFNTAST